MTEPLLLLGDCRDRLAELEDDSVDAIVTDPPYGLGREPDTVEVLRAWLDDRAYAATGSGFMSKAWDAFVPDLAVWRECFRVLKPGGYLLTFSGTRTVDLVGVGVRLAGFERRDLIAWMYGSGFPKSRDVAKAIDAKLGVEGGYGDPKTPRHAEYLNSGYGTGKHEGWDRPWMDDDGAVERSAREYLPGSPEAAARKGWGTALKPAFEPIVVARKPLRGNVAENVLAYGTAALNIDGCRVGYASEADRTAAFPGGATTSHGAGSLAGPGDAQEVERGEFPAVRPELGRWPANVILGHADGCVLVGERRNRSSGRWPTARPAGSELAGASGHAGQEGLEPRSAYGETVEVWECADDCPVRLLDAQTGELRSGEPGTMRLGQNRGAAYGAESRPPGTPMIGYGDVGGASRFFYTAKASRAERNAGLDGFEREVATVTMPRVRACRRCERKVTVRTGNVLVCDCVEGPDPVLVDQEQIPRANVHPTVKPIALMRWLVRLVTPPDGLVLDPFLGSGTTGIACALEGMRFVGVEGEAEYLAIAEARIRFWAEHGEDALRIVAERDAADQRRRERSDAGQLDLFSA